MPANRPLAATLFHGPSGRKLARVILTHPRVETVGPLKLPCITHRFTVVDAATPDWWVAESEVLVRAQDGWQAVGRLLAPPAEPSGMGALAIG